MPLSVKVTFKSDLQRETRWLAQYGQPVCVAVAAVLIWQLDRLRRGRAVSTLLAAVLIASLTATAIKFVAGRVRPGRENAGQFLGPLLQINAGHLSFPSGHTTAAVAMTVVLSKLYPRGRATFWTLALACAALRYLTQAHWLSDVLAGVALGYAIGNITCSWSPAHDPAPHSMEG